MFHAKTAAQNFLTRARSGDSLVPLYLPVWGLEEEEDEDWFCLGARRSTEEGGVSELNRWLGRDFAE
jgi:hypothetical protein